MNVSRFSYYYDNYLCYEIILKFNLDSLIEIPKINKCIITLTSPSILTNLELLIPSLLSLNWLSGQNSSVTKAKKSIASFKLRKEMETGTIVTLIGNNIYNFLEFLIYCILPIIRNIDKKTSLLNIGNFDSIGNFSFSIPDVFLFPQIETQYNNISLTSKTLKGINITIIFSSRNQNNNLNLLASLQFPI